MPSCTSFVQGRARPARTVLAAAITLSLVFGVTAARAENTSTTPPAPPTFTNSKTESFSTPDWWKTWGVTAVPWHSSVVTEGASQFLRVNFPRGSHNGTSFEWYTGTADAAHIRYRLRLSSNWISDGGKLPGFGAPTYDARGDCTGACGLAPADGITSWSARGHINTTNVPGSYLYIPGHREWLVQWSHAPLVPGRWYTIDYWVTMNTPGQNNGVLKAAVDGSFVLTLTNLNFREVDTLHVGKAWFGFYYGGRGVPSQNMWIDVDDVTVDW